MSIVKAEFVDLRDVHPFVKWAGGKGQLLPGFNGLYRVNRKGEFNVPPGEYKNPLICDSSNLENISYALSRATIFVSDYRDAIENAQKGDFIYLDPPCFFSFHLVLTASFCYLR